MRGQKVYEQLISETFRLNGWGNVISASMIQRLNDFNHIFEDYIFRELSDQEVLEIRRYILQTDNHTLFSLPHGLEIDTILLQTKKVLTIMELSENMDEFEKLYNKTKKPKPPPQDFDQILQSIFQIGKPPNEKKPPG